MNPRHETTDMNPKYVVYFAVALVIAGIAILAGVWWMFHRFEQAQTRRETRPSLIEAPKPTPEPRLQINPQDDLQELLRQENEILSTYGWVDRAKGTARIPIDRAMELFLQKGTK